jgi:predicted DNA-binding transcriptional regulator AlpA
MRRVEQQRIASRGLAREATVSENRAELHRSKKLSASQETPPKARNKRRLALSEVRPVPRRALSMQESAMYLGISAVKFGELVRDGTMPSPKRVGSRRLWDVRELDVAFDALPTENNASQGTTWDDFRQEHD